MSELRDIYAYLADEGEYFVGEKNAVRDIDIVDVKPSKNDESSFWSYEVTVRNPGSGWFVPFAKRRLIISERDQEDGSLHHVGTGRIQGWPVGPAGELIRLTVSSAPPVLTSQNANDSIPKQEELEDFAMYGISDDPYGLFSRAAGGERLKPEERLGARFSTLHWKRSDLEQPVLVDLANGSGFLDIGANWIEGTLKFDEFNPKATTRVEVVLDAEFEQTYLQIIDLMQGLVNNMLDKGVFQTLNPEFSMKKALGDKIGDWTVVQNVLTAGNPATYNLDPLTRSYSVSRKTHVKMKAGKKAAPDTTPIEVAFNRFVNIIDLKVAGVVTARRKETIRFAVEWKGQNASGYQGVTEKLPLSCSNLRGFVVYPDWQSGTGYGKGATVMVDGLKWQSIEPHVAGGEFYADIGKWMPLVLDVNEPLGGPGIDRFFSRPAVMTAQLLNGVQQIYQIPAPGKTAVDYAFSRAKAMIFKTVRGGVSFDVPWWIVRDLVGTERVRLTDPQNGTVEGKVVSISASLVGQRATVKIAPMPGKGTPSNTISQPDYPYPPTPTGRCYQARIINDGGTVENQLANFQYPQKVNLSKLIEDNKTQFDFSMSPLPKGADLSVDWDMGTYLVDAAKMIELGL